MAKRRLFLSAAALVAEYQCGRSALQLAQQHGCSLGTVLRRLRESGVSIRGPKERVPLQSLGLLPANQARFIEIVDGLLLGDAHITRDGSLRLGQTKRNLGWLQQVQRSLQDLGVPSRIIPVKKYASKYKGRTISGETSNLLYTPQATEQKT